MGTILRRAMGFFPRIEILIRMIYWNPALSRWIGLSRKGGYQKGLIVEGLYDRLLTELRNAGIGSGDLVVLHSSMDGLSRLGVEPTRIIDDLLDMIGKSGTLAMPVYPPYYFRKDRFYVLNAEECNSDEVLTYRPDTDLCWTGMLPLLFLGYPNVVRSRFPYNPLAAKGLLAEEMMRGNLDGDYPHGVGSSWEFCMKHRAKFLFLGVRTGHSFTLMHAVEDLMGDKWPVDNWYVKRRYKLVDNRGDEMYKDAFNRRVFWSRYAAIEYTDRILVEKGFIRRLRVDGVPVELVDNASELVEFAMSEADRGRPCYYFIPKRFYKGRTN